MSGELIDGWGPEGARSVFLPQNPGNRSCRIADRSFRDWAAELPIPIVGAVANGPGKRPDRQNAPHGEARAQAHCPADDGYGV